MKILVAPNALKGSLDAFEAARAIATGLARSMPCAEITELPVADGGDGTARVLALAGGGEMVQAEVNGPRGMTVRASFGVLGDTAIVEVASAVGLALLATEERDPLVTTSHGAGQLVLRALDLGCRRVVIGLGGSATVDGAGGLVAALGGRFLDGHGNPIAGGGGGLAALERIDLAGLDPRLAKTELTVVCDVDNPLLGERGAARVFGPQKAADPRMVKRLRTRSWEDKEGNKKFATEVVGDNLIMLDKRNDGNHGAGHDGSLDNLNNPDVPPLPGEHSSDLPF